MYGGLEVAEQLELNGEIVPTKHNPYVKCRGVKLNIPLDARTTSYDDTGDAAQKNIEVMWDWSFWEEYLDKLAINRINVLTLWNPHPFPSMIKLENYPDVSLNDIHVTTLKPTGKEHERAEPQMVSRNVVENVRVAKEISIDEKIAFWQKVMQRAHDRGIDIYFFTWNICPNGAANPVDSFYRTYHISLWDEEPGRNGITNQMDNPITAQYYRESVKTFLLTSPHVKGIGVTAGEHMMDNAGEYTREQWIWEAYGLGVLEVKKEQPDREVDFIHRVWNTNMDKIMHYWKDYPDPFYASFKYAKARLYSSPTLHFGDNHMESMKKYDLESWWNLCNDDIFVHRWENPEYVRKFIYHFDEEYTAGFYMGSDGYVWGEEFVTKDEEIKGQLEIDKHWYKFMLWGRLAYNTELDSSFFVQKITERYPETNAYDLYKDWTISSKIIPKVNCFHWKDWDYQWSVKACIDMRTGFHDVYRFIDNPTLEKSNMLNPKQYAKLQVKNKVVMGISPYDVAQSIISYADTCLCKVSKLKSPDNTAELNMLLDDVKSMAYLGYYYAYKIKSATQLAIYEQNMDKKNKENALKNITKAYDAWKSYSAIQEKNYYPQMLARTGIFNTVEILKYVKKDIEIAEGYFNY